MAAGDGRGRSRGGARRGRLRRLARIAAPVALVSLTVWIGWEYLNWPDVSTVLRGDPGMTAYMEHARRARREAGHSDRIERVWVPYEAISPELKRAVLVAEDINFFSHRGFERTEIREAMKEALAERRFPRGASTITQQVARNLWLSPSRNPVRKLREAVLTWQLERRGSKKRILELYLNIAEFGPGVWGAEAAARRYFGKPASALTGEEAARLAAALPRPAAWNPERLGAGHWRVEMILRRMEKAGFLGNLI